MWSKPVRWWTFVAAVYILKNGLDLVGFYDLSENIRLSLDKFRKLYLFKTICIRVRSGGRTALRRGRKSWFGRV